MPTRPTAYLCLIPSSRPIWSRRWWLRRMSGSMSIPASTSSLWGEPSSSAGSWGRQVPVVAVRSRSSWPNSSIPTLRSQLRSDCCKNPSSGSRPSNSSATSPRKRSSLSISTISTSSMVLWASRQLPTPISIRSQRILPSTRRHCSSVCARIPRCSILCAIPSAPSNAAMWCWVRCSRPVICQELSMRRMRLSPSCSVFIVLTIRMARRSISVNSSDNT